MTIYLSMEQVKEANRRAGFFFFSPSTLRFFRSRIGTRTYCGPGGIYFITSEQFAGSDGRPWPRRYTVRRFDPETGGIGTAGEFNELTRAAAVRLAERAAAGTAPEEELRSPADRRATRYQRAEDVRP